MQVKTVQGSGFKVKRFRVHGIQIYDSALDSLKE